MRFIAHIMVAILTASATVRQVSAQAESNDISFTAIVITNGSNLNLELTAPPREYIGLEWSLDLVTWNPLEWLIVGPSNTYNVRPIYVASEDGMAVIPVSTTSDETRKYYRAIKWEPPPFEWPQPVPSSKTKRKR